MSGNAKLKRAARNLTEFKYVAVGGINVFDLLKYDGVHHFEKRRRGAACWRDWVKTMSTNTFGLLLRGLLITEKNTGHLQVAMFTLLKWTPKPTKNKLPKLLKSLFT